PGQPEGTVLAAVPHEAGRDGFESDVAGERGGAVAASPCLDDGERAAEAVGAGESLGRGRGGKAGRGVDALHSGHEALGAGGVNDAPRTADVDRYLGADDLQPGDGLAEVDVGGAAAAA